MSKKGIIERITVLESLLHELNVLSEKYPHEDSLILACSKVEIELEYWRDES